MLFAGPYFFFLVQLAEVSSKSDRFLLKLFFTPYEFLGGCKQKYCSQEIVTKGRRQQPSNEGRNCVWNFSLLFIHTGLRINLPSDQWCEGLPSEKQCFSRMSFVVNIHSVASRGRRLCTCKCHDSRAVRSERYQ